MHPRLRYLSLAVTALLLSVASPLLPLTCYFALRQAQIALITGDYQALGQQRGLEVQQRMTNNLPGTVSNRLSHPYYWASFILIGNGL